MHTRRARTAGILLASGLAIAAILIATLGHAEEVDDPDLPGIGWWSGITVQNAGGTPASITLAAIGAPTPTPASPTITPTPMTALGYQYPSDPVLPARAAIYLPSDFYGLSASLTGSGFVNSLQPLKGIVTLTNRQAGSYGVAGGLGIGMYEALDFTAAAHDLYFPTAKKAFGPKSTLFFVQNAGLIQTSVTATFWCGSPADDYPVETAALWPGEMAVVDMPDVDDNSLCILHMAADAENGGIAGVAAEYYTAERGSGNPASLLQVARGFTTDEADYTFYIPVFKNKYPKPQEGYSANRSTGLTVANVNGGDTFVDILVTYAGGSCTAGDSIYLETTVPAHGFKVFYHPIEKDGWSADMPEDCWGTAWVFVPIDAKSRETIVTLANESFLDPVPAAGVQSAAWFNGIPGSRLSPVVYIPLFKERLGNRTSGLTVQNATSGQAQCHVAFFAGSGEVYTTTWKTIPARQAASYNLISIQSPPIWTSTPMPDTGAVYSARVECDRDVAAVVSEASYYVTPNATPAAGAYCFGNTPPTPPCFDRSTYTGFNATNTPTPTPTPTG